jgi:hypothetical protein
MDHVYFNLSDYPILIILSIGFATVILARLAHEILFISHSKDENAFIWLVFGLVLSAFLSIISLLAGFAHYSGLKSLAVEMLVILIGSLSFLHKDYGRDNLHKFMFLQIFSLLLWLSFALIGFIYFLIALPLPLFAVLGFCIWIGVFLFKAPRSRYDTQRILTAFLLAITILMMPLLIERALNSEKYLNSLKPRSILIRI